MSFWIVTDACCDLPAYYIKEQSHFSVIPMSYQVDGEPRKLNLLDEQLAQTTHAFYEKLLKGSAATTSQVTHQEWVDALAPLCEQGNDVLVLAFSSGLSGTFASCVSAVQALTKKFSSRKIFAVDSYCASMGQGLFVHHVLEQRKAGKSIEECLAFALETAQKVNLWFTVDDLHFLRRGGRVSASSAYLGSILKIKPVLNVDPNGKLIPREKVQGRKHSLRRLFERAQEFALEPENQTMFISHGDCEADAMWLAKKLKKELHVREIVISFIGPVIGSHSGPGTVALFFLGKNGEGRLNAVEG